LFIILKSRICFVCLCFVFEHFQTQARFDILHYQTDVRFASVAELEFTVGKVQSSLPLISVMHPFIAVLVLLMIVVLNATGVFSIYEAAAIGIIVLLVTDTMSWKDVYTAIPGNLMLMICYSFALAAAMTKSGLGQLIGQGFAIAFSGNQYIQLFGLYLCTPIVTAITPNSAGFVLFYFNIFFFFFLFSRYYNVSGDAVDVETRGF
jgi:hypothetical protein